MTANFLGSSTTFEVTVEELEAEQYSGTYELVTEKVPTATEATLVVDYSHKTCAVTGADGVASISGTLVEVGDGKLTMTLNGSDPFDAILSETDSGIQITIPAHQEKVAGWGPAEVYDIAECTLNIVT